MNDTSVILTSMNFENLFLWFSFSCLMKVWLANHAIYLHLARKWKWLNLLFILVLKKDFYQVWYQGHSSVNLAKKVRDKVFMWIFVISRARYTKFWVIVCPPLMKHAYKDNTAIRTYFQYPEHVLIAVLNCIRKIWSKWIHIHPRQSAK